MRQQKAFEAVSRRLLSLQPRSLWRPTATAVGWGGGAGLPLKMLSHCFVLMSPPGYSRLKPLLSLQRLRHCLSCEANHRLLQEDPWR